MLRKSIFTATILAISGIANAQTQEQREVIKASMNKEMVQASTTYVSNFSLNKEIRILEFLRNHPEQNRHVLKDGKMFFLYDITEANLPIYINTKDKAQQTNAKSTSLYSTGSIGVDITGTNMVAGVWDGGQVNANHEILVGRATMQAGQSITSTGGDDHQTAVTGIMVGKLNNTAQGIAYNAVTKNFDWDNDLAEMNTFSGDGYLISNHSYGYSNDNSVPVWQFGAYDNQAKAWDALLKAKPFYLPFIAAGNEQQSNGNSSANGFDIITGSSASKNVVTVGAIDNNNSMSDYSNWGPTDDGRIKPEIVTQGTSINVPLYGSNTGYTGSVPASSGTSYSSPAAAACALLLQQYYYSLNNAYMKSAMLKALLLHSADDDASGNGPDAKFGWGILNVEKAANIIKQNSTTNGSAKMSIISTNPANNGTDEVVNSFNFGSNGVRASLCWLDDEGTEQISGDGVNNNSTRMVYNFSMKLEQASPALSAFPYKNLSVTNPSVAAVPGTSWFESANNYLQANLSGTTDGASGKVLVRKSPSSPSGIREMALIVTGIKSTGTAIQDLNSSNNIIFFNKISENIQLISAKDKLGAYQIYSIDGKLVKSGSSNSQEIDFKNMVKNTYIVKYSINGESHIFKFTNN